MPRVGDSETTPAGSRQTEPAGARSMNVPGDVVGFDTATPQLVSDFARDAL